MTNKQLFNAIAQAYALNPAVAKLPLTGLQQIALQEGCETEAYQDSLGNLTIGIGHLGANVPDPDKQNAALDMAYPPAKERNRLLGIWGEGLVLHQYEVCDTICFAWVV